MKRNWTEAEVNFLKNNLRFTNSQLAAALGRPYRAICVKISRLGLNRNDQPARSGIKSKFSPDDISFIRENIQTLSNRQLADHLGKTLTVVRNKIYELGLKRNDRPEEWTPAQVDFLRKHFRAVGDVQLGEMMQAEFPRARRLFGRKSINKKRQLLGLYRTDEEIQAILDEPQHKARCNTILQNSGSIHYRDGWVAMTLATKNHPEKQEIYLRHPRLIDLKRAQLKLNRELKRRQKK